MDADRFADLSESEVLTDDEYEDDSDDDYQDTEVQAVERAGYVAGEAVLSSVGVTGLPKEFCGDVVRKVENSVAASNNNKGEILADRWAERFRSRYPSLQYVVQLGKSDREYLESLNYDDVAETPDGDGKSHEPSVKHVDTPPTRLLVEGSPVKRREN